MLLRYRDQHAGKAFGPEGFTGAHHVRNQEDGGRHRQFPQYRKGELVIVRPPVVEGDGAGLVRQRLSLAFSFQPFRELHEVEILCGAFELPPEVVRRNQHAGFFAAGTRVIRRQDPVIHEYQQARRAGRTHLWSRPRGAVLEATFDYLPDRALAWHGMALCIVSSMKIALILLYILTQNWRQLYHYCRLIADAAHQRALHHLPARNV